MHPYAIFAAYEHMESLIEESARNRAGKPAKPSIRRRVANAAASIRSNVATSTYEMSSIFPKLEDYPYRG